MFKKTLNTTHSFFEKVQLRVIDKIKENIPLLIKKNHKTGALTSLITGFVSCSSIYLLFYMGYYYSSTQFPNLMFLIALCFSIVGVCSGFASVGCIIIYFIKLFYLKRAQHMTNSNSSNYKAVERIYNEYLDFKPVQSLTDDEFSELLSLPLNPKQIKFLQTVIAQHQNFTLEDLKHLDHISFDETIEADKKLQQQNELNQFLSQRGLISHPYMILDNTEQQSKEISLSSRL